MRKTIFIILFLLFCFSTKAQETKSLYDTTFLALSEMLEGKQPVDFKKAVFLVENSFLENKLDYQQFCKAIDYYKTLCEQIIISRELQYQESDKDKVAIYAAVFTVMKDTVPIQNGNGEIIFNLPLEYDFEDITGDENWTSMFVTKLLMSHKGNCHSLPYLYKIITEEFGEKAYLAYAPNHIYIKQHCKAFGWYNTELTSGMFPIDSWLMASGYVHLKAVQNGIFMDTLSQKQSIAACMIDLAQGYEKKYGIEDGAFIIKACKKVFEYYPNNINAMLLQAETKMTFWKTDTTQSKEEKQNEFVEIQGLYTQIHELGYRAMPEEMYLDWLVSLKEEKHKYQNKKINLNIK